MRTEERKPLRLDSYDYSQPGTYFVTICTLDRSKLFWSAPPVGQGLCPCLSVEGNIAGKELETLAARFPSVTVDKYVIMDDHIHALLTLDRQGQSPCPTLGAVIGAYKSITTKRINEVRETQGKRVWQRRFYDHVIRDENDFLTKWNYIDTNPCRRREQNEE